MRGVMNLRISNTLAYPFLIHPSHNDSFFSVLPKAHIDKMTIVNISFAAKFDRF